MVLAARMLNYSIARTKLKSNEFWRKEAINKVIELHEGRILALLLRYLI
jgi:hypothetical protein